MEVTVHHSLALRCSSGSSAARLARLVRDEEVGGSNPLSPTWIGRQWRQIRRCPRSSGVERVLGKNEVGGSNPPVGLVDRPAGFREGEVVT